MLPILKRLQIIGFLILLATWATPLHADQEPATELKDLNYEELELLMKREIDRNKDVIIATEYLRRAKESNSTYYIAKGFFRLSSAYYGKDTALTFIDSCINRSQHFEDKELLTDAYLQKGSIYNALGKKSKALHFYNKSKELAQEYGFTYLEKYTAFAQGLIQAYNERDDLAIKCFLECLDYFEVHKEQYANEYCNILAALANSYIVLEEFEKADEFIRQGTIYADLLGSTKGPKFRFMQCESLVLQGKGDEALEGLVDLKDLYLSLDKRRKYLECLKQLVTAYIHADEPELAKSTLLLLEEEATTLTKIDIVHFMQYPLHTLCQYYEEKGDLDELVYFLKKKASIDSLSGYHQAKLGFELASQNKENHEDKDARMSILPFVILAGFLAFALLFTWRRHISQRVMQQDGSAQPAAHHIEANSAEQSIDDALWRRLVSDLEEFEKQKKFLYKNYTILTLAKKLKTNKTYLSKVINAEKNASFSQYMKQLKMKAIYTELESGRYDHYGIDAIAQTFGYKSRRTFSRNFKETYGLTPSKFINLKHINNVSEK